MSDRPTVQQLLTDEALLRQAAGAVLKPGPWKHSGPDKVGCCLKCRRRTHGKSVMGSSGYTDEYYKHCPVPDPDTRELAVIADELVRRLVGMPVYQWYKPFLDTLRKLIRADGDTVMFWLTATPAERIACCLVALDKARLDGEA